MVDIRPKFEQVGSRKNLVVATPSKLDHAGPSQNLTESTPAKIW